MKRTSPRLAATMWLIGLPGVLLVNLQLLPRLLEGRELPLPMSALMAVGVLQGALLLALAAWAGAAWAPRLGLRAPLLEALAGQPTAGPRLSPWPGLLGGLAGAALLLGLMRIAPPALAAATEHLQIPLAARLFYGGITEEVLLRWGLMSALLALLCYRRSGPPPAARVWIAIAGSALLFGIGHLPAAQAFAGGLDASVITYVVGGNAAFGLIAGYLFWRHGLESAIVAHMLAHLLAHLAS